ncbi:FAD-binding domain-containing protein [Algoriphagus persicinus]|uniref:FAD-binding domain-containing protein n=1 Tax=Algoriphagus persicinus TaxID=3108754 RepID=UPI002B3F0A54|nr:FAD-binding domain-containing protein [Algoriphagus sp. E1-3-M2]MEB2784942.1 FAD-binding domain-containing protein [Algoriphagus sp. E1-3-M2]
MDIFPTDLESIENRIRAVDPEQYTSTRNYNDGAVTRLSPYISRGVISTKQVFQHLKTLNLPWYKTEKLVQELAWRDYWQQVWRAKGEGIKQDIKHRQQPVTNHQIPAAIVNAETGIEEVDEAIKQLYRTGYMHNHMRMYVASICCNVAKSHWLQPAKWMYSHLLDGDLASNYLSWQWVSGAFSSKKYYANQWNINTYFNSTQQNTFLDVDYEEFECMETPRQLLDLKSLRLETVLPTSGKPLFEKNKTSLIYNYYNIDPYWYQGQDVQRVFLIEPSFFQKNPVSQKCLDFALDLTKNIVGIQTFVGEFSELAEQIHTEYILYKEHPASMHYKGREEPREWMSSVEGFYLSFFAFWKKCKKEIRVEVEQEY